ncbi:MAG: class I SAM-dependent methyltransferase [bacterium]
MDMKAMEPHGMALEAYFKGDTTAELIICRDDGLHAPLQARHFFREPSEFTAIEKAVLDLCRGRILDVGAGTGLHSLVLQEKGLRVTAIDIIPQALKIMKQRGVIDARCLDIFNLREKPFDTILVLGHGIGLVETISGLDRFLAHVASLLSADGQILLDSLDVRITDDPANLAYQEANRQAGRYPGEIRLQFEFQGVRGPCCGWLHVDDETLRERANKRGLKGEIIRKEPWGEYLARLTRKAPSD